MNFFRLLLDQSDWSRERGGFRSIKKISGGSGVKFVPESWLMYKLGAR